jgi:RND family efflux transporter MFP subunit
MKMKKLLFIPILLLVTAGVRAEVLPVIFEAEFKAVLAAERAGVLSKMHVDVGSRIAKGKVLAELDTGELYLQRKRSEHNLKFLNVQLENFASLNKRAMVTDEELAKVRMERDVTRTEIKILTHKIIHSQIRAPFDGVVVNRAVNQHEWVTEGQAVLSVLNPNRLRVIANVPVRLAVKLKPGDSHLVVVQDLGKKIPVTVKTVAQAVDAQSNTVQVIWRVSERAKGLLSGMKGELVITP